MTHCAIYLKKSDEADNRFNKQNYRDNYPHEPGHSQPEEKMSEKLLIIRNISREGPGLFREVLTEHGIPHEIRDLSRGEAFPAPSDYRALVVLGGPDSTNDASERIRTELARIRQALDAGIPYLGICLGMQLLVKAAGGRVVRCPTPEIGFRDSAGKFYAVALTETGQKDPLLAGITSPLPVFHLHGETVEPTAQMQPLGTGRPCRHQIIKAGPKAYGIQGHAELTAEMLERWLAEDPDLRMRSPEKIREDFAVIQRNYTETGKTLFTNFLRLAGLAV